jgi:hypothetical protein
MPGRERRSRRGQIYKRKMAELSRGEKPKEVQKEDSKKEKVEEKKDSVVKKLKKALKKE